MRVFILFFMIWFAQNCWAQQETLLWSDEFEGTGLPDNAKWGYDTGNSGFGNNEIQNYTNTTQNVRQENGSLIIDAIKSGSTWTSARVLTRYKFEFTYGRIVFRAKLPAGSGTWPALWMLGANLGTVGWPACGEVDVMEHVGKDPGVLHSAIHTTSSSGNTVNTGTRAISTFNTDFHLYQANWKSDRIEFSIDDVLFYSYRPSTLNTATWPFDKACFIIMNIAMGGNWGSDPQYESGGLKNGILPSLTSARMEVDYVRVYQTTQPNAIEDFSGSNQDVDQIIIYPNPSSGLVRINLPAGKTAKGTVSDVSGKELLHFRTHNDSTEIDLSAFTKGIYCISLQTERKTFTKKILLK